MTGQLIRGACLTILLSSLSGCEEYRSEGRAAAILDRSKAPAQAHRDALLTDDITAIRRTGGTLISGLACWWADCTNEN